jgi:hypothetical protein
MFLVGRFGDWSQAHYACLQVVPAHIIFEKEISQISLNFLILANQEILCTVFVLYVTF